MNGSEVRKRRFRGGLLCALAIFVAAGFLTGCEDDDFDHDPPAGKGTLYIVNNTGDGMDVFFNGKRVEGVGSGRKRYYDLDPGVYRVVLDGDDSPRSWGGDVDLLADRKTIMDVGLEPDNFRQFDVFIFYR
jgi:hypothetical protein